MALNSAKFRIDGDGSGAMRALSEFKRGVREAGDSIQQNIQGRLQQLIAPAAIEEIVRRTEEWSNELIKASREMGVGVEEMQALRIAAQRAGQDIGKIEVFYDRIASSAQKAMDGNRQLINSFSRLGVTYEQYKNSSPAEIFNQIATFKPKDGQQGQYQNDLSEVFGHKNLLQVHALLGEFSGRTMSQYKQDNASMILPDKDVKELAIAWQNTLDDLKRVAVKLSPIVKGLALIIDGVVQMLSGVIAELSHLGLGFGKYFTGAKDIGQYATERTNRNKAVWEGFKQTMSFGLYNPKNIDELTKQQNREGQGAGGFIGTLLTFGVGPLLRLMGIGARGAGIVSRAGIATKAGDALSTAGQSGAIANGISGLISKPLTESLLKRFASGEAASLMKEAGITIQDLKSEADIGAFEDLLAGKGSIANFKKKLSLGVSATGIAGMAGISGKVGEHDVQNSNLFNNDNFNSNVPENRLPNLNFSGFQDLGDGNNPNRRIGGIFGEDVSLQVISLNQRQCDLLQLIVDNTTPNLQSETTSMIGNP